MKVIAHIGIQRCGDDVSNGYASRTLLYEAACRLNKSLKNCMYLAWRVLDRSAATRARFAFDL